MIHPAKQVVSRIVFDSSGYLVSINGIKNIYPLLRANLSICQALFLSI